MSRYLSIVACFRDETPYLSEWIDFHLGVGIEHFYLYDNFSSDDYIKILQPYIDRKIVTLTSWPIEHGQKRAYNDAVRRFRKQTHWIAFIDVDEFLFSPLQQDVRLLIKDYEGYPAVTVNWVCYGSSGHIERPAMPVTQAYLQRGKLDVVIPYPSMLRSPGLDPTLLTSYRPINTHVKTIAQSSMIEGCSIHCCSFKKGHAVNELFEPVSNQFSDDVSISRLRLNHYWSKSKADVIKKIARGRADGGRLYTLEEFENRDKYLNDVFDPIVKERYPLSSVNGSEIKEPTPFLSWSPKKNMLFKMIDRICKR